MNIITPPSSPRQLNTTEDNQDWEIYSDPFYLKDLFLNRITEVISNDEFTQMLYRYLDFHDSSCKRLEKLIYQDLFQYVENNPSFKSSILWLKLKTDIEIYKEYKNRDSQDININIFVLENTINNTSLEYLKYITKKKNGSYHHFLAFYFYHLHFERLL